MASELERKPLREWRVERMRTVAEVAQAVGVAESSVRNWEKYGKKPHLRSWRALAAFLEIHPRQILFGADIPKAMAA